VVSNTCVAALSVIQTYRNVSGGKNADEHATGRCYCEEATDLPSEATYSKTIPSARRPLTTSEEDQASNLRSLPDVDDLPNLARHPSYSLLKKHLNAKIWNELRGKKTSNGVTLEDIIRPGTALPACTERVPVVCGDAESYQTFAPLLEPILTDYHRHRRYGVMLQRHESNLDYKGLQKEPLDRAYILHTSMRLARSLSGFRFVPCQTRIERRQIQAILRECLEDFKEGRYRMIHELKNADYEAALKYQHAFGFPTNFHIHAGMARDWPDGRGFYSNKDDSLQVWVNAWDHIWIISKGLDVQDVFTRLSKAAWALETSLQERGHSFVEDPRLGFLNSSPVDIGTALRASVRVKLVRLSQHTSALEELSRRLRLEVKQVSTGIFDIANEQALGRSEVELINVMINGVRTLIDLEKRLEKGEDLSNDDIISA